jgi:tRNA nucleotidyltransferase (CCA-adding enzyme)
MPSTPSAPEETRWELYAHGADVGIRGRGPSRAAAFEGAALALTAAITDPQSVRPHSHVPIRCAAADDDGLLYEWINALVYEMATRCMLFGTFRVQIADHTLVATVGGESLDPQRHQPAVEVKGATFTDLRVGRDAAGWIAQCIIDV